MNQPRVEYLVYRIIGRADYTKAAPLEGELDGFRIAADGEKARLYPAADFATQRDALDAAEPVVKNWESMAALQNGPEAFRLRFDGGHIVDLSPTPGESYIAGSTTIRMVMEAHVAGIAHHRQLPDLPAGLSFEGTAGFMLARFNRARAGNCGWMEAGYYIYTGARLGYQSNRAAAAALKIPPKQLKDLSEITSTKGGPDEGRKVNSTQPLTAEDMTFVQTTCRDLILRMARLEGGSDPNGAT